ncbi:MAG: hypothetical protein JWP04_3737, partial [Belnapia sp.]|nr:hypothetical protein [Belnapia sp.]
MSKLSALALGLGLAITTTISAIAAPTLSIQIFDGATLIGSVTNVAGGSASTLASDANFSNIIVSAQGVPVLPTPNLSSISINATSAAATTHTLTVKVTQTGL